MTGKRMTVGRIQERSDTAPAACWQWFSAMLPELVALGPAYISFPLAGISPTNIRAMLKYAASGALTRSVAAVSSPA